MNHSSKEGDRIEHLKCYLGLSPGPPHTVSAPRHQARLPGFGSLLFHLLPSSGKSKDQLFAALLVSMHVRPQERQGFRIAVSGGKREAERPAHSPGEK